MSDVTRLRQWLSRAAPRRFDLVKALIMATAASLAATGLFIGAISLLVVSAQRPGLRAIAVFLIAIELVAFVRSPLRFAERMSTHRLGFGAVARWRQWLMTVVGGWDFTRWQRYASGDLLERALGDTDELQDLWLRCVIPSVAAATSMFVCDLVVALMAPLPRWWLVATVMAIVQIALSAALIRRLGALARLDRQVRLCRATYVASLVSSRAAAPEIERLGASDFLRRRDNALVESLAHAESRLETQSRRDALFVLAGPLVGLLVVALAHPRSAPVWTVVATLVAVATFDALATLRGALYVAVAVIGGAERLEELEAPVRVGASPWPEESTLVFRDVALAITGAAPRLVSARVAPGRRLGVMGPSGSGKSTLLRALAGLDPVHAREISIGGRALHDIEEEQLRSHVVLVPSEPGLLGGYVRDVVGMGVSLRDEDMSALAHLGLRVERNDIWEELSRGERQRAAIVRALARRDPLVFLDEPTSALGENETDLVLGLLSGCTATLVIASHDPRVLAWCDEVLDLGAT